MGSASDVPRTEETHRFGLATSRQGRASAQGVLRRHRWSPTIGNAPCRLEVEREVSEGCGLGEERLGRWCTEEREESGGAGQISPADGASVLGRATGRLAQEGGVRLRWLGSGREGKGQNGDGTVADVRFEKKSARWHGPREGKRGGRRGRVHVEAEEGGEGAWHGGR
jgi:hypothetical protein